MITAPDTNQAHSIMGIEGWLTLLSVGLAFVWPRLGSPVFLRIERTFGRLARKKAWAVVAVGITELVLRLALLPLSPIPWPFIPDDFSFLLSGDTFASGRLANPTPARWTHFETIHVSMQPTYGSMYFPAQGLALAAGKVLFGDPWFGLLIVNALMCAAICWALQAWLPPGWALLGGFLAVLRLGLFSYWINTYTGAAAVAALAGALVLGSFPRLMRFVRVRDGVVLALGIVVLAMSRPYEGLLLCVPVAIGLGHWILFGKSRPAPAVLIRRAALPLAVLVAGAAWMADYDYRAFGNPLTLPYTINRATYAVAPYWIWQSPRPEPVYRHPVLRDYYVKQELPVVTLYRNADGFVVQNLYKPVSMLRFYAGIVLLPPLLVLLKTLRDQRTRFLVVGVVVLAAGMFLEIVLLPHYVAPFTVAFYAIGLQCMRHLRAWRPAGRPVGLGIVRALLVTCVAMAALRAGATPLHLQLADWAPAAWTANWYGPGELGAARAHIVAELKRKPGKQLVLVRYSADHNPVYEWVYNAADIEDSKVIWAREMDSADNQELIRYYKDRKVWLVQPDLDPATLSPYPLPEPTQATREDIPRSFTENR